MVRMVAVQVRARPLAGFRDASKVLRPQRECHLEPWCTEQTVQLAKWPVWVEPAKRAGFCDVLAGSRDEKRAHPPETTAQ